MRLNDLSHKISHPLWAERTAKKALAIITQGEILEDELVERMGLKNRQTLRQVLGEVREHIFTVQAGKSPLSYCLRFPTSELK